MLYTVFSAEDRYPPCVANPTQAPRSMIPKYESLCQAAYGGGATLHRVKGTSSSEMLNNLIFVAVEDG